MSRQIGRDSRCKLRDPSFIVFNCGFPAFDRIGIIGGKAGLSVFYFFSLCQHLVLYRFQVG